MIKSVGIDLAGTGEHKVRCMDEGAQLCDGFDFQTTPEGLATLEERIFQDGANPVIVFEPTGLSWFAVAVYLRARHSECRLVRTQARNVAAQQEAATEKFDRIFETENSENSDANVSKMLANDDKVECEPWRSRTSDHLIKRQVLCSKFKGCVMITSS